MTAVPSIAPKTPFNELPKRNQAFIKGYVKSGDSLEAYLGAGYKNGPAARSKAGKLLRKLAPYLDEALEDYVSGVDMAIQATSILMHLAENSKNDTVRFNAAKELRARALPEAPQEQVVTHKHEGLPNQSLDDRIAALTDSLAAKGILIPRDE